MEQEEPKDHALTERQRLKLEAARIAAQYHAEVGTDPNEVWRKIPDTAYYIYNFLKDGP